MNKSLSNDDHHQQQPREMFKNPKVAAIDNTFTKAINQRVIFNYVDDVERNDGSVVSINGKVYKNFGTCSYMGFDLDNRARIAASKAALEYGTSFVCTRPYASCQMSAHFEKLLDKIFDAPSVLMPSTSLGSLSFMYVFMGKGDVVILDQSVHSSVQIAASIAATHGAEILLVEHNNLQALEKIVKDKQDVKGNIWYCCDGVYSMFGDVGPIHDIIKLLDKYENLYCYADDAHGMSITGKHGRGYVLSKQDKLHSKMVVAESLSKAFSMGSGACLVFPNEEWKQKFFKCAPSIIFSTQIPPCILAAGIKIAEVHLTDEIYHRHDTLKRNIDTFQSHAEKHGINVLSSPESAVQFVKIGDTDAAIAIVRKIMDHGFFVNISAYPAVAATSAGVRIAISCAQNEQDIINLVQVIKMVLQDISQKQPNQYANL